MSALVLIVWRHLSCLEPIFLEVCFLPLSANANIFCTSTVSVSRVSLCSTDNNTTFLSTSNLFTEGGFG